MLWARFFTLALGLLVSTTSLAVDTDTVARISESIVQTKVVGVVGGETCKIEGTGFFISGHGHLLTAAHNVTPCPSAQGDAGWQYNPQVKVEVFQPNADANPKITVDAVVVYRDEQTDIALLRADVTRSKPLHLAPPDTLTVGSKVFIMTFETTETQPSNKDVTIQALFNPNQHHGGLIDITGPGFNQSSSGGPLFDENELVAGILTKGVSQTGTGEAVVPISFASGMIHMAGVSYPSEEVREALRELRRDIVSATLKNDPINGNVTFIFVKRLRSGFNPIRLRARFVVYTKKRGLAPDSSVRAFTIEREVLFRGTGAKEGAVVFAKVGVAIDEEIDIRNERIRQDPATGQKELGAKIYALVDIEAEFASPPPASVLRGRRLEFQ